MICLDTTFIIDFLRGDKDTIAKAGELGQRQKCTTAINISEVLNGILLAKTGGAEQLEAFGEFLASIEVFGFDVEASLRASQIYSELTKKGEKVNELDCQIAGAALANHCSRIITRNSKHFARMSGIEVETY